MLVFQSYTSSLKSLKFSFTLISQLLLSQNETDYKNINTYNVVRIYEKQEIPGISKETSID